MRKLVGLGVLAAWSVVLGACGESVKGQPAPGVGGGGDTSRAGRAGSDAGGDANVGGASVGGRGGAGASAGVSVRDPEKQDLFMS